MRAILLSGAIAMLVTLLGTRAAIQYFTKHGYGQFIRDDGPTSHHTKRGTPTMGGLVIIVATVVGYFAAHLITWSAPTVSGLLILWLFVGMGAVGFADDWTKISKQRSLGLNAKAKLIGQGLVAGSFAVLSLSLPDERGVTPASYAISFLRDIGPQLPAVVVVIWIVLLIAGTSNAVNLTDGLDGLATGACAMVFASYTLVNIWQSNQSCGAARSVGSGCYAVRDPLDLAIVSIALAGACFGFLWWNAKPAKIIMGDSGSLSLGAALAGLAIYTRTELLLVILGGLFVVVTMSVIMQVGYFKITHGRRLFKMAPLHHHLELLGWAEVTIVIRFWIIAGICSALGLGLFYGEWVAAL